MKTAIIRQVLLLGVVFVLLCGCANTVSYKLMKEYKQKQPHTVAILPIGGEEGDSEIRYLFRTIAYKKLIQKNFNVLPLEKVDEKYLNTGTADIDSMPPHMLAELFNVDSILYCTITDWNKSTFATYASLKVKATFELYARDGTRLWRARHGTKEYDVNLDRSQMKLAIITAYEPRIQRLLDAVFMTLPSTTVLYKKKTFFKWLP